MTQTITVQLKDGDIEIDKRVFLALLDLSPIKSYVAYKNTLMCDSISFTNLKFLANKADVPYPLFFAPLDKVIEQINDFDKNLYKSIPSKTEIKINTRGRVKIQDIKLLLKDLSRKQLFLNKRISPNQKDNKFVGLISKEVAEKMNVELLANLVREFLEIELDVLRSLSKTKVIEYLTSKAEKKNILVTFSSHDYMVQNLKKVELSGICLLDRKFPTIFINTKDGDDDPRIIEPEGRQTFTLAALLVCVAMRKFVFSNKTKGEKVPYMTTIFAVASELLIPKKDIENESVSDLNELKVLSNKFKTTPSMCIMRLLETNCIDRDTARLLKSELKSELRNKKPGRPNHPLPENAYLKYNGRKLSIDVFNAFDQGQIPLIDVKNILFRKGKMGDDLLRTYRNKIGI